MVALGKSEMPVSLPSGEVKFLVMKPIMCYRDVSSVEGVSYHCSSRLTWDPLDMLSCRKPKSHQ